MNQYGRAPVHYPCDAASTAIATECFLVEGDSAAKSVDRVRDRSRQAILALQGKPLNAVRASVNKVTTNDVFIRVARTLVSTESNQSNAANPNSLPDKSCLARLGDPSQIRYERLVLLMDPDADGIHCGVIMMGFFRRFASALIEAGRLYVIHPPMIVFRFPNSMGPASDHPVASSLEHAAAIEAILQKRGLTGYKKIKHRGLGSLDAHHLHKNCIDPSTRQIDQLTIEQVDRAIKLFGG